MAKVNKTFLGIIWFHTLASISQGITSTILLLSLWWLSPSTSIFFNLLQSQVGRTIKFWFIYTIAMSVALFLINLGVKKHHQYSQSVSLKASLKEIESANRGAIFFFKYLYPSIIFFLIALNCPNWLAVGENWNSAILSTLVYFLPFPLALVMMHLSGILIEVGILILNINKHHH